jgi:hypothetical protein
MIRVHVGVSVCGRVGVCICVCVSVCRCVCVSVCPGVCGSGCMFVCMRVCVWLYVYVCMCMYVYGYVRVWVYVKVCCASALGTRIQSDRSCKHFSGVVCHSLHNATRTRDPCTGKRKPFQIPKGKLVTSSRQGRQ